MSQSTKFGTEPIGKLLRQQAIPASIGILIMSIYGIIDTIFVGRWVGSMGIAAITVVMPIVFLIGAIGMSIGIGSASLISRSLGEGDRAKAHHTFGNAIVLTIILGTIISLLCGFFIEEVLILFGGKGAILQPAMDYFRITLFSIPCLAWAMMSNNVIRAEGYPKVAMFTMIVPAVANLILDPIFIVWFEWGIQGAAWATALGYFASAAFTVYFFIFGKSELRCTSSQLLLNISIVKEISAIGSVTLARQGTISLLYIVLNNALFRYGGEISISVYGIVNRLMMFVNFPVIGIMQGFLPIAGYNYGADLWDRVMKVINVALRYGTGIGLSLFALLLIFAPQFVSIFTTDPELLDPTPSAIRIAFLATPLIAVQLIGSAYFQAIGQAKPALFLALSKQGFFLIPLILILPPFLGLNGIWISFPIADTLAAALSYWYLKRATQDHGHVSFIPYSSSAKRGMEII